MAALAGSCAPIQDNCPKPVGEFQGTYNLLNGTCTRLQSRALRFDKDEPLFSTIRMGTLGDSVVTEKNFVGCTIEVKQQIISSTGTAAIEGELTVHDGSALSGQLRYSEVMPDGVTELCRSQVSASYTLKDNITIGSAAQSALANP